MYSSDNNYNRNSSGSIMPTTKTPQAPARNTPAISLMTKSSGTCITHATTTNTTTVEDKLHGMADSFRRDRDDAQRRQMTASERLHLTQQEYAAMRATVESMMTEHQRLMEMQEAGQVVRALKDQVELLTKEVCVCVCHWYGQRLPLNVFRLNSIF
jgi:hypothetical protein